MKVQKKEQIRKVKNQINMEMKVIRFYIFLLQFQI